MNKKLPFEEAFERQMNNLPSPNEEESWQKMKKLLDDNDKRKSLAFLKTYKVLSILILLLLIGVWFVISPSDTIKEKPAAIPKKNDRLQQKRSTSNSPKALNKTQASKPAISDAFRGTVNNQSNPQAKTIPVPSTAKSISEYETKSGTGSDRTSVAKRIYKQNRRKQNNLTANKETVIKKTNAPIKILSAVSAEANEMNRNKTISGSNKNNLPVDTISMIQPAHQDAFIGKQKDSLYHKEDVSANPNTAGIKVTLQKPKKYFVSAGIGVQQQIPVAGQQVVPYGYNGNTMFSDYIPSIYFRFEREQKWFLQGEFIYGAPQLLKEFAYSRQTKVDSSGAVTTTLRLKKAFYNEIPVSFNYYLRPNWSAGIGATYSWFYGAIAEKEINTHNFTAGTNAVVRQVVPIAGYTDSFLYRSHTYLMLQTDYQWRRLSLGLRYTKDVQPYIKYTLPNGAVVDQKNWSLQFILRFRLWKSLRF